MMWIIINVQIKKANATFPESPEDNALPTKINHVVIDDSPADQ